MVQTGMSHSVHADSHIVIAPSPITVIWPVSARDRSKITSHYLSWRTRLPTLPVLIPTLHAREPPDVSTFHGCCRLLFGWRRSEILHDSRHNDPPCRSTEIFPQIPISTPKEQNRQRLESAPLEPFRTAGQWPQSASLSPQIPPFVPVNTSVLSGSYISTASLPPWSAQSYTNAILKIGC